MILAQILAKKKTPRPLVTITPATTLKTAMQTMCANDISALLVVDAATRSLVGILTHQDIIRCYCAGGNQPPGFDAIPVCDAMTREVILAHPDDNVQNVMGIMSEKHIRHLPVIDPKGGIMDIVSVQDILTALYEEDELEIRYLGDYLEGTYHCTVY